MGKIEYFKSQAKKLYKDYQTKVLTDDGIYSYSPKYFDDVDGIIVDFDIDEESFTLMKAQHIIALLSGFNSWKELIHASQSKLELGQLLLSKRNDFNSPLVEDWEMYKVHLPKDLRDDDENLLLIFKKVFLGLDE